MVHPNPIDACRETSSSSGGNLYRGFYITYLQSRIGRLKPDDRTKQSKQIKRIPYKHKNMQCFDDAFLENMCNIPYCFLSIFRHFLLLSRLLLFSIFEHFLLISRSLPDEMKVLLCVRHAYTLGLGIE